MCHYNIRTRNWHQQRNAGLIFLPYASKRMQSIYPETILIAPVLTSKKRRFKARLKQNISFTHCVFTNILFR